MRNRFEGKCIRCSKLVKSGEGYFQKLTQEARRWVVRCRQCVGMGNKPLILTNKQ